MAGTTPKGLGDALYRLKSFTPTGRMRVRELHKGNVARRIASFLATQVIRLLWITGRWHTVRSEIPERLWQEGEPFIVAFWHGRLLMVPYAWQRGVPVAILISRHRDGELIAKAVEPLGLDAVRGSAAKPGKDDKGGAASLRTMLRLLKYGTCVGITPDGPRGPRMRASDGVVSTAMLSGVPVVPLSISSRWGHNLHSWDRFLLPYPFSRGVIVWGEPILIDRNLNDEEREAARLRVETALNDLTEEADRMMGRQPIEPDPEIPADEMKDND